MLPDKLFIAIIKKGSNSVNTGDSVMVLAFCNFPDSPLSVYQVSLNYRYTLINRTCIPKQTL